MESLVEKHQATEVTHQYDIEKLQRKVSRAEADIDELEERNKNLLIAQRKSRNTISHLKSLLDKSEEELNKLKRDIEAKERRWKQQENELRLQLASKSMAQSRHSFIDSKFDGSKSSSKRGLNIFGSDPPMKKQKIMNLSNRTNPNIFPTGCTLGPFGVPTKMEQGIRMFLQPPRRRFSLLGTFQPRWTADPPQRPQSWVMIKFPNAVRLPRMNSTQRRELEKQALQKLMVADLKEILQEHSLKVSGMKAELVNRVTEHLSALYEEGSEEDKAISPLRLHIHKGIATLSSSHH